MVVKGSRWDDVSHWMFAVSLCVQDKCPEWAADGKCGEQGMESYMHQHCAASCEVCLSKGARVLTEDDVLMTVEALSREVGKEAALADADDQQSDYPETDSQHREVLQSSKLHQVELQPDEGWKEYVNSSLPYTALIRRYVAVPAGCSCIVFVTAAHDTSKKLWAH